MGPWTLSSMNFCYFLRCLMTVSKKIFELLSFWRDTVDLMPLIVSLVLFLRVDVLTKQFMMFFSTEEGWMSVVRNGIWSGIGTISFGNSVEAAVEGSLSSSGQCPGAAGESQALSADLPQPCVHKRCACQGFLPVSCTTQMLAAAPGVGWRPRTDGRWLSLIVQVMSVQRSKWIFFCPYCVNSQRYHSEVAKLLDLSGVHLKFWNNVIG